MITKNFLKKLPYPIRQGFRYTCGTLPLPMQYGKIFRKTYTFLNESQWQDKAKLKNYQLHQLQKLLQHAYTHVPYYQNVFNESGLKPNDFQSVNDLSKLLFLTKDIVRESSEGLIAKNYPKRKLYYVTTSGSTGNPLGLFWDRTLSTPKELAFVWRQWNWAGFKFGDKRVVLRGNIINRCIDGNSLSS